MKSFFICLCLATGLIARATYADVLIITNKNVSESTLSQEELTEIFLGKRIQWKDNSKIHFVLSKDEGLHEAFLKSYIKKSASQFKSYWKNMVFTGKGATPTSFDTTPELVEYVANTPGAVGYIDSGTTAVNVKTINIE